MVSPVLVALDAPSLELAMPMAKLLREHVGGFKVGLELLMSEGSRAVEAVVELGLPVFADAKLHDIPNTAAAAAKQLGHAGARWVTAHASGGAEMISAAVEGLRTGSDGKSGVLAVTVLTSLDRAGLAEIGVGEPLPDQVQRLATLAFAARAEGVICAVHEVGIVKTVGGDLTAVTPGIRPGGADADDQKRVATPKQAVEAGADFLVVGRAITKASDPVSVATSMAEEARLALA